MAAFINWSEVEIFGLFGLPGHWEIIIIALVILLLFGGRKLPELARGLGRGLRAFKEELKGVKTDIEETDKDAKKLGNDVEKSEDSRPSEDQSEQHDRTGS